MRTENQLLPCPFCGEEPHDAHHIEYGRWAVTCQCGVHGASASTGPNATDESKIKAYTDARAAWNARAAITQPAQPAEGGEAREFFAYHSDMGVEFFNGPDAEAAAKSLCDENLKLERAEAISTDEWAYDRAESIRWGVVLGRAKFFENPGQEGEDSGDYKMVGYTAPPASQEQPK